MSGFSPGQFLRFLSVPYAGLSGVYVGVTLGAWGTDSEGTWVCVRLTSTGQYVTVRHGQLRAERRSSEEVA